MTVTPPRRRSARRPRLDKYHVQNVWADFLRTGVSGLLTNPAKCTEPGGRTWPTAERVGGKAELRVRNSGIGIGPEMLPHIFELFGRVDHASTKAQGGLGIVLTLEARAPELLRRPIGTPAGKQAPPQARGATGACREPLDAPRALHERRTISAEADWQAPLDR